MTRNIVGNVPEPDELFGRNDLLDTLWRQIRTNNILLLAPRRFGKTGIMHHVLTCPERGFLPMYLDLEDVDSPSEFVWRLLRELLSESRFRSALQGLRGLPKSLTGWIKDAFDEVEFEGTKVKFKESISLSWRDAARKLLVELEKAKPTLIFILDELPAMLEKITRSLGENVTRDFLAWFRAVRLQRKDALRRHRFIVGGSIGIDLILRKLDVPDKLNDFQRLYVEPISGDEAVRLSRNLAETLHIKMTDDHVHHILGLIGANVPYFIHLIFSQLGQSPSTKRQPLTREILEKIFHNRVLGPTCKHYFDHYRTRLARYGRARERRALAVLQAVASQGKVSAGVLYDVYVKASRSSASERDFNEMMADLQCEWYLVLDIHTNEYYFMIHVMREWWRRWYGSPRRTRGNPQED